jgi:hypothetical protein
VRRAFAAPPLGDPVDVGLTALRSLGIAAAGGAALEREHAFDCGSPSAVEQLSTVRAGTEVDCTAAIEHSTCAMRCVWRLARVRQVKPGSLLLTHPVSCLKQPTLHHAVILISTHPPELQRYLGDPT